jgi:uncharacterized phage-associated protein
MSAFRPLQIANAVLEEAATQGRTLTIMQLLKLVYIAHGWSLGLLDAPLVSEEAEAWQHGPVFPSIYREFRRFGAAPIPANTAANVPAASLTPSQRDVIRSVVSAYGHMHAFKLSQITHEPGTPWFDTYRGGQGSSTDIPDRLVADHYKKLARERQKAV